MPMITEHALASLHRDQAELKAMKLRVQLQPFMNELQVNLMMTLGCTRYEDWPQEAKNVLQETGNRTSRALFLNQLPE